MSTAVRIDGASVAALRRGVRLTFDRTRERWVLLAPERLFVLDQIAHEIVRRCDGRASVDGIVTELAQAFAAPRDVVLGDVVRLLQDFADKRVLTA